MKRRAIGHFTHVYARLGGCAGDQNSAFAGTTSRFWELLRQDMVICASPVRSRYSMTMSSA